MQIQQQFRVGRSGRLTAVTTAIDPQTGQEIPGPRTPPPVAPIPADRVPPVAPSIWRRPVVIAGAAVVLVVGGVALFRVARPGRSSLRVLDGGST